MGQLSDLIDNNNVRVLSLVGLAKNTGKTTTLNHLIRDLASKGIIFGLTSAGRDGEDFDVLTSTIKKPSIYVSEGRYIATASQLIKNLGDNVIVLSETGFRTQMGNVLICKINNSCMVQLAGPITNKGVNEVANNMLSLGCKYVVIDGSINRLSIASSNISDAIMLMTGASVHEEMSQVISKTKEVVDRFSLEEIEGNLKKLILDEILPTNRIALIYDNQRYELIQSIIGVVDSDRIVRHINKDTKYVFIPGAFFEDDAKYIVAHAEHMVFIVEDGSKIFFNVKQYKDMGLQMRALNTTKILSIMINPDYPTYYNFDKTLFLAAMRDAFDSIPVCNLGICPESVARR